MVGIADKKKPTPVAASSNWLALQKKLKPGSAAISRPFVPRKRQKTDHEDGETASTSSAGAHVASLTIAETSFPRGPAEPIASTSAITVEELKTGDLVVALRSMIEGNISTSAAEKRKTATYLAIDCEMVGVGMNGGEESSLARVSLVNWHGAVVLDELVQQRERVVDYRTKWSGIRPRDMINAKPFEEVQKTVADLIHGKVLVGHAIHHDLKALLLSHPHYLIRDTQSLAHKHKLWKSKLPSLKGLVKQEFGVDIQLGEHSSVIDARATMAIYRLHRQEWEAGLSTKMHALKAQALKAARLLSEINDAQSEPVTKRSTFEPVPITDYLSSTLGVKLEPPKLVLGVPSVKDEDSEKPPPSKKPRVAAQAPPGGGRKGVSSGLSTVVTRVGSKEVRGVGAKRVGGAGAAPRAKTERKSSEAGWWKEL